LTTSQSNIERLKSWFNTHIKTINICPHTIEAHMFEDSFESRCLQTLHPSIRETAQGEFMRSKGTLNNQSQKELLPTKSI
jgi:hypothetical protein